MYPVHHFSKCKINLYTVRNKAVCREEEEEKKIDVYINLNDDM
jgi:hypothetical protein